MSPKHLDRYVQEFAGKHNLRESDTIVQMREVVSRLMTALSLVGQLPVIINGKTPPLVPAALYPKEAESGILTIKARYEFLDCQIGSSFNG